MPAAFVMKLKKQTIEELKELMARDYKVSLSGEELAGFGIALLRLTRIATTALARANDREELVNSGKRKVLLEPKTSKE